MSFNPCKLFYQANSADPDEMLHVHGLTLYIGLHTSPLKLIVFKKNNSAGPRSTVGNVSGYRWVSD